VAALAFWPVVSGTRSFFHLDLRYEHLPVWAVVQKALLEGQSPFWLDGEYCGHPLLYVQEAPVFYPALVPLLLTGAPVGRLADLFSLLHFWLAGFSVFLLLRDLEADHEAALFGGVAWMLSARLVRSAIWPNAVAVSALLPLLLLGILRIARGARRSGVLLAAAAGGLALLAARPQVLVAAAPFFGVVTAGLVVRSSVRRRFLTDLLLAALLAVAIGSASLVPAAALHPEMSRAGGLARSERDIKPLALGRGLDMVFLPVDRVGRWPELAAYLGLLVGLAVLAGIVLAIRRARGFSLHLFLLFLAGGTVGLVFAFGEAGPYGLIAGLPLLRGFRLPVRYLFSWSLALALGAGMVLSWLLQQTRRPAIAGAAALLLLTIDLVWHARLASPTALAGLDAVEPEVVEELRLRLGQDEVGFPRRFRTIAEWFNLLFFAEADQTTAARVFDPLFFSLGMRFGLESSEGGGPALKRTETLFSRENPRAMELGGVGCLVVSGSRSAASPQLPARPVVQTRPTLPRALLVPEAIPVDPAKAVSICLNPALDLRRTAIVEDPGAFLQSSPDEPRGTVRLLARRPSQVELLTSAPGERLLVFFDAFEKGWDAYVDGRKTEMFRADGAFRGVRVPGGTHRVLQVYSPPGIREGVALSLAGLLGLLLVALRIERSSPIPSRSPTAS
jgi:hypothetical protein